MNNPKYKISMDYIDILKIINFFKFKHDNSHCANIISYFITIAPQPMIKLSCRRFDNDSEFYEYTINYIVNNRIAKYSHIEIEQYNDLEHHHIIACFNIIDKELLIQLI